MAQLYIGNVNFESTGNNQITYASNTVTFRTGNANRLTINSTAVTNAAGVTVSYAGGFTNVVTSTASGTVVNNSFTVTGAFIVQGNVTPTAIAANTADWAPGTGNVYNIRVSGNNNVANSEYMITGMTAGTNGQVVILNNIGPMGIWIRNEEAGSNGAILPGINTPGSTAANRFNLPNHFKLQGYQSAIFYYDGTLARWRLTDSTSIPFDYKTLLSKSFSFGGQTCAPTSTVSSTVDRVTYATEVNAAAPGATLLVGGPGRYVGGTTCKILIGNYSAPSTFEKTLISTEVNSAIAGLFLATNRTEASASGNACKVFFTGGGPTIVSNSCRVTYSTEAIASVPSVFLTTIKRNHAFVGNACKGYAAGGYNPAYTSTINRITYASETNSAIPVFISSCRVYLASGTASQCGKGYLIGGQTPGCVSSSTVDRITYSTETTAAVPGANLIQGRRFGFGVFSNGCKAFSRGGNAPARTSTAERTTFSTETTAAVTGANLSTVRSLFSGA